MSGSVALSSLLGRDAGRRPASADFLPSGCVDQGAGGQRLCREQGFELRVEFGEPPLQVAILFFEAGHLALQAQVARLVDRAHAAPADQLVEPVLPVDGAGDRRKIVVAGEMLELGPDDKKIHYETGELKWKQRGLGCGSLIAADGKLIILAETGDLVLAEVASDSFKELTRTEFLTGRCWTSPILANGRVFGRNADGTLVCVKLPRTEM